MDEKKQKKTGLSAYKLVSETIFVLLALGSLLFFLAVALIVLLFETNNLYRIIYSAIIIAGYCLLVSLFYKVNKYVKSKL